MPLIRPEAFATLARWREVALAFGAGLAGLWIATRGGPVLAVLGLGLAGLGAALALGALRRLRFQRGISAPGLVEVVEGEVRFFGPNFGGGISLAELTELRLLTLHGRRMWRLKQADGQALLVPIDATGAEALYDAFTSLPGLDMAGLLAALAPTPGATGAGLVVPAPDMVLIWHRKGVVPVV